MSFLKGFFDAYNTSDFGKEKKRAKAFKELEAFPMLHSSEYLNSLTKQAKTTEEYDLILDHLYKHETLDIDSYKNVEQNIIDLRWK